MIPIAELATRWEKDPGYRRAYAEMEESFQVVRELLRARERAGLSQLECAERMKTTQSVVARLESGRQSPSVRSLRRYAAAVGCRLEIRLVPLDKKPKKSS